MLKAKAVLPNNRERRRRRLFTDESKEEEAVQLLLDGHTASSVCGLSSPNTFDEVWVGDV